MTGAFILILSPTDYMILAKSLKFQKSSISSTIKQQVSLQDLFQL